MDYDKDLVVIFAATLTSEKPAEAHELADGGACHRFSGVAVRRGETEGTFHGLRDIVGDSWSRRAEAGQQRPMLARLSSPWDAPPGYKYVTSIQTLIFHFAACVGISETSGDYV